MQRRPTGFNFVAPNLEDLVLPKRATWYVCTGSPTAFCHRMHAIPTSNLNTCRHKTTRMIGRTIYIFLCFHLLPSPCNWHPPAPAVPDSLSCSGAAQGWFQPTHSWLLWLLELNEYTSPHNGVTADLRYTVHPALVLHRSQDTGPPPPHKQHHHNARQRGEYLSAVMAVSGGRPLI
jgi:hypothetical protein